VFITVASRAESIFAPVSSTSLTGTTGGVPAPRRAVSGMITNAPPLVSAGVADSSPAIRTRSGWTSAWLVSVVAPRPRAMTACGEASTGCGAPAAAGASSRAGTAGNVCVAATSAAYWAGSTASPVTSWPSGVFQPACSTCAACVTPGTAASARVAAGDTTALAVWITSGSPAAMTVTSAPALCQDAATSPLVTASLSMPANVATVSARTSANAGSAGVSAVLDARASPTNEAAPDRRAEPRSSPRSTAGYTRSTTTTAGIAMRAGAALVKRFTPAPAPVAADAPCCRNTMIAAIAARHAVTSATSRIPPWPRRLSAARRGSRCCQAATAAGAQTATSSGAAGIQQPPAGVVPGISSTPRTTATAAAGTHVSALPAAVTAAIWVSEAPRARRTASSADLRIATMRAASRSVIRPAAARLT